MEDSISVIIPAHDEEKHIERCIGAISGQSLSPKEIIVVANGCKDRTAQIARELGAKVIETSKSGVSYARNMGAKAAKGSILLFIDADTYMSRKMLSRVARSISKGYIGGVCRVKGDSRRLKPRMMWAIANLFNHIYKLPYGLIFCRADRFFLFDERRSIGEDAKFLNKLARKGKICYITRSYVITSMRRFERSGYLRTISKIIKGYFFGKNNTYEPVR